MAQADYIRGAADGYTDMLSVIVAWLTGTDGGTPHNTRALWTKLADYVDEDTGSGAPMNGDGERCVILRGDIAGELPIYIGLRTFRGYEGLNQQGIQINAYTHFDADLPWDCQAGSLASSENYVSASHFYEGCPAILVGNENVCYWLNADAKRLVCTVRTPVIPQASDYTKIRQSVCYEMFYLGWAKRIVSKEGYPYPMVAAGTTYTLGNSAKGYVQRNFAYNNIYGSLRHIPPFHWDYMMYEGLQSLVFTSRTLDTDNHPGDLVINSRWPLSRDNKGNCGPAVDGTSTGGNRTYAAPIPLTGATNPLCGPTDADVSGPFSIPCIEYGTTLQSHLKTAQQNAQTIFVYDQLQFANRIMYFDGFWGWYTTNPVRNAYVKSLCWCTHRVTECGSYNYLNELGSAPPLSTYDGGIKHDQVAAHYGWNPEKVVESLSGKRLLVPVYMGAVGSVVELQSNTRSEFGSLSYDGEQHRIQIAGVMDGLHFVPGLGLSAQDILKISEEGNVIQYLIVPDVYRRGAYNYCAMLLGATEWHEQNPGATTPRDNG